MASRWKHREHKRRSTWRQSLLFNSLLLLLPVLAARIIWDAYTTNAITDPTSIEARTETRSEIESAFAGIGSQGAGARAAWAARIDETLKQREFSAARGYLLAAPSMLSVRDARAIEAAADAEAYGSEDQRLARAALLFLPDNVRANYERVIAPPRPEIEAELEAVTITQTAEPAPSPPSLTSIDPLSQQRTFNMLGDSEDLARRTERWMAGEQVDDLQLRLRALGLIINQSESPDREAFVKAVSILRGAQRAGRLNERFVKYMRSRIEDAIPTLSLRQNLTSAIEPVLTTTQRSQRVLEAYQNTINPEAMQRLTRDMSIIARLSELTSASGAIGLVEQVSSPDDMRRVLLIAEASGDRSVALSRELGPDMLDLAQIGVKWTFGLALQVMALMALGMALIWTTLSAFTQAETVRVK